MPHSVQVQVLSRAPDPDFLKNLRADARFLLPGAARSKGEKSSSDIIESCQRKSPAGDYFDRIIIICYNGIILVFQYAVCTFMITNCPLGASRGFVACKHPREGISHGA